ncbi:MAG: hypothetical protein HY918_05825 [Candidatus Doudnabacteria bacterium]|nr:hypothetical protein [Candidatus Doudnabacteria bacterium]
MKQIFKYIENSKLFLYFSVALISIMTIGALYAARTRVSMLLFLMFLPILFFTWLLAFRGKLNSGNKSDLSLAWIKLSKFRVVLFYYSLIFSSIIIVGGFLKASMPQDRNGLYVFLPVVIFFWSIYFSESNQLKV